MSLLNAGWFGNRPFRHDEAWRKHGQKIRVALTCERKKDATGIQPLLPEIGRAFGVKTTAAGLENRQ
jgi:hypothetical protein